MFSKTIVQGLALSVLASVAVAQDCPQNGAASSLFQSCGQVQGSMNVCTTGAVTSCSCSVLAHQSACYSSYKENYCSAWVYQNDYFSANCGDNYADESSTSSTKSDKPASTSAEATTTAESASATDDASSSSSASSRSSSAASASATASSGSAASASASASRSGSSSSGSSASGTAASASGTASASASATTPGAAQQSDNAGAAYGLDGLLMAGGLLAALF
ncbi:hypothetical protein GTA08_BOTSDO13703 [Neofusicoccum parvum]|uniref:Uncharacterized protein n=2 Tax=Neofusicoccum parvum TaxID=310453 RepID=R1EAZ4_BOTPV|nr:hypothetical protein UCRNP2_8349 [Neofusicoccum parvum UCRNP2]GME23710.1 hypothetical protein GTA08_BOTSDO13703 [Neofusicoccum parvum]GME56121.1 hypothetical protein GTA08_BOTSDO13703 [Neofusicoccum parvum]